MDVSPLPTAERPLRSILAALMCTLAVMGLGTAPAVARPVTPELTGVNISGAQLNYSVDRPGRVFFDYIYPSERELDYFRKKGANVIRVPVQWERLQHDIGGPINPNELKRLQAVVDHAARLGLSNHRCTQFRVVPGCQNRFAFGAE